MNATSRPCYTIVLRPEPGIADPIVALRAALKVLLRRHGLRCLEVRETKAEQVRP